ncbi:MAG: manganese efflux pump MntP family protein [Roseburia sp.]|nr:manganese efflux pump MntP family protein [Anaeroplasma bactoclasticum]MCM1197002.1 manganese efflux pump MntP family protein [Roseburia sp.]MCM1556518.1 manganese efflux pump MntP family protein [Anaeroplasma bactoclasticum]
MWLFILNSILLGIGLTMDAFSVSIADGLNEPNMKKIKMIGIASIFAIFQFAMPLIGWICVHTIVEKFNVFRYAIPWIALALLAFIGGKMIFENIKSKKHPEEEKDNSKILGLLGLLFQGIATSIDALSVGFTIADYNVENAIIACTIIGVVTLGFCIIGLFFGKKISSKFSSYAELIGGIILIGIGLEIFISGMIELFV